MRKKFIIGMTTIFLLVVLGGVIIAGFMTRLENINQARYQMDRTHQALSHLQINILRTIEDIRLSLEDSERLGSLLDRVESINLAIASIQNDVLTERLAQEGCGACHAGADTLVSRMGQLLDQLEGSFEEFTFMASLLITGGKDVDEGEIIQVMRSNLDSINSIMTGLDGFIDPMIDHMASEVNRHIARINRSHDMALVITIAFVLLGIVIFTRILTRPMNLLTEGTKAIVHGDYDFRIDIKGEDEMGTLAQRFNTMAEVIANREISLKESKRELEDLNESLEKKVSRRTQDLREKQEELNRKYLEMEATNEELHASYLQLQSTASDLEETQGKLQENYDVLKEMNRELARANEVKNKFLSIMSHELRTPLTVINGYLSLILDKNYGEPSPELKDILKVIKEQAKNQLGLIEDLLDLTRIESGEFRLFRQPCDTEDLLQKVIDGFRPKFQEMNIEVTVDVQKDLPLVYWDNQKMLQVFLNLVDNAIKFTPPGGWITLGARAKSEFIEIRVSDNGIGIPKERIEQVFERFYQVDSSSTRQFGGSGLGLSIVREIIVSHRGKIFVESEEGKGTTFLVLMPVGEPERPSTAGRESDEDSDQKEQMDAAPKGNGESILIVDDDPAFLRMMETVLPREGYKVHVTERSTGVVEYAKKLEIDVIMLDLMMPEVDGYEACRRFKLDPETRHIPILIVSATGGREVSRKVYKVGADDHLTKPFDQQDLLNRLYHLLENRQVKGDEGPISHEEGEPESSQPRD
jgi:signal transduction histidine kinase/CheY-like chemotaxis protein